MSIRPDWDDYFFHVASVVASRATCPRAQIGAVLVKGKRIIGSGYNGVSESEPHCPETVEHMQLDHCRDAVHAEYNALANALVPAFGATLYVVGPRRICSNCADLLRENGVTDIRWQASVAATWSTRERELLARHMAWADRTFPRETLLQVGQHLVKEIIELQQGQDDPEEYADVYFLAQRAVGLVRRYAGLTGIELIAAAEAKLLVNEARTWAEGADGVFEHVREAVS